ncbi:MAG: hypothetical protein SGPRY_005664 [Prymnesium sp.]
MGGRASLPASGNLKTSSGSCPQRDIEARKREKREFELERAKLREKLAADRAEKIKQGLIVPHTPSEPKQSEPKPSEPKPSDVFPTPAGDRSAEAAGMKRNFDEPELSLEEAQEKLCAQSEMKIQAAIAFHSRLPAFRPFLALFSKLADNIAKHPAETKYRKVRLTNPKLAEGLVHVAGARQFLRAIGWRLVEEEFLELATEVEAASQVGMCLSCSLRDLRKRMEANYHASEDSVKASQELESQENDRVAAIGELSRLASAATERRRVEELAARKKEIADKAARAKAEKEAIKAAMARDRGEVLARGPAEASIAKPLPSGQGGTGRVMQE